MFDYIFTIVRHGIRLLDITITTIFMYFLAWLPFKPGARWYRVLYKHWCLIFCRAMGVDIRLHQHYMGKLPERYILIANHPSCFEDVGVPAMFDVHALGKKEVAKWFIVGRIGVKAGNLFFNRESKEARAQAKQDLIDAVNAGKNIAIYPEGGCKSRRIHYPFLFGAFEVSLATGVPILPVFLEHEAQEDFDWTGDDILPVSMWRIFTSCNKFVHYHVYDPFDPKDFSSKEQYSQFVYNQYVKWQEKHL